jgi:hypothetical protein
MVKDYVPPPKRPNGADDLLEKLLNKCFFVRPDGHLEWCYRDGVTVADIFDDDDFERKLVRRIKA